MSSQANLSASPSKQFIPDKKLLDQPSQRGDKSSIYEEEYDSSDKDDAKPNVEVEEDGWDTSS